MSDTTKIQWARYTFNPWIGCTKCSPGCAGCYAEKSTPARVLRAGGKETWGKGKPRHRTSASTWKKPLKWNREAEASGVRPRVFPSLCDPFDDEVPIAWLVDFIQLIYTTPHLNWLLLTKRPENWFRRIFDVRDKLLYGARPMVADWMDGQPPANVWMGASAEDQQYADQRIPELLKIPAKVRFLSVEPLLGPLDLSAVKQTVAPGFFGDCLQWYHRGKCHVDEGVSYPTIDWVIVGGESGKKARPCNVEWIASVVKQCRGASVPVFVKQLGAKVMVDSTAPQDMGLIFHWLKLKHAKGGNPDEWPNTLRIRQFPHS